MNTGKKFKVGIYLRLSREDDDYKEESASITNQRDYIMNYLRSNDDFIFVDEYVDDGFSGGDFERPDFKRLIVDIEYKKLIVSLLKTNQDLVEMI